VIMFGLLWNIYWIHIYIYIYIYYIIMEHLLYYFVKDILLEY
jgi:hypothetical protein